MDGTPFTQNQVQPGGKFLYKFKVSRPGIYWYHPHHHASTNQVFKGLYGMILITDPNEAALQASGTLPSAANTLPIVLSDTTVCHDPGGNEPFGAGNTYDLTLPWVGPLDPLPAPQTGNETGVLPAQASPHPEELCEAPTRSTSTGTLSAGAIPRRRHSEQPDARRQRADERGPDRAHERDERRRASGHADGSRSAGGAAPRRTPSQAGQGLRLQMLNAATTRFMRLRLTDNAGALIPLVRVGGEGGLIDNAVVEGGVIGAGFDTKIQDRRAPARPGQPRGRRRRDPGGRGRHLDALDRGLRPHRAALLERPDRAGRAPQRQRVGRAVLDRSRHARFAPRPATPCRSSAGRSRRCSTRRRSLRPRSGSSRTPEPAEQPRSAEHPAHADRRPGRARNQRRLRNARRRRRLHRRRPPRARRATPRSATRSS